MGDRLGKMPKPELELWIGVSTHPIHHALFSDTLAARVP